MISFGRKHFWYLLPVRYGDNRDEQAQKINTNKKFQRIFSAARVESP